jgi:Alginate export
MAQTGSLGSKEIRAWALGSLTGFTFTDTAWHPRIGLQMDAASGNQHPGSQTIGTFNPLFPNGYYFTLASYTGYTNLIHIKPSITITPIDKLKLMGGIGLQWRQTTADAVYTQPDIPVAGTAGHGGLWTGAYTQIRADYAFNANITGAVEAVHYAAGDAIRRAGGHDSDYIGVELKYAW